MDLKELFEAMKVGSADQNEAALDVLDEIMGAIRNNFPSHYKKYEQKLEGIYSHSPMTLPEAKSYVAAMKNKDGSVGEHWTYEQVEEYRLAHPEYQDLNPICFYAAVNMMYSDYYKPTRPVETYASLAKDFLKDKDAPADKLKRYFEAMRK